MALKKHGNLLYGKFNWFLSDRFKVETSLYLTIYKKSLSNLISHDLIRLKNPRRN